MKKPATIADLLRRTTALNETQRSATVKRIRDILHGMGLPMPEAPGVLPASDGILLFLDEYGLVLRFETTRRHQQTRGIGQHPLILQPLGKRGVNASLMLEVCPGTTLVDDPHVAMKLYEDLENAGVSFSDVHTDNVGIIRLPDRDVPVVIDRGAVESLGTKRGVAVMADPQREIYANLREAFQAAWPVDARLPDADRMRAFMTLAKEMTQKGVLVAGWTAKREKGGQDTKPSRAAAAGRTYAAHIARMAT